MKKRVLSLALSLLMLLSVAPLSIIANAQTDDDFVYSVENGEAIVTAYHGTDTVLTIPDTLGGYPVTAIGDVAFVDCEQFTSITLGKHVASIGEYAFSGCKALKTIDIPGSVTSIGSCAFTGCFALENVEIPNGITAINERTFANCRLLKNINIPNGVTSIGSCAFTGCYALENIIIPNSVTSMGGGVFYACANLKSATLPNNIKSISNELFYCCPALESISIPESVTSIGSYSFCGTGLKSMNIPKNVSSIGYYAFSASESITNITVSADNAAFCSVDGVLFNKAKTTLVSYPSGKVGAYTIPTTVTNIAYCAFTSATKLTSVIVPNGVQEIGYDTFAWCNALESATLPNTIKTIAEGGFRYCTSLKDIYFGGTEAEWKNVSIDTHGYGNQTLLNANIHYNSSACSHDYKCIKTVAATYSAEGYKQYRCSKCSATYKTTIQKLKRTSISKAKVSGISDKTYTGKALTQKIKVKLGSTTLKNGTDYKVTYKNNKNIGTASVIITGTGKYSGTITKTFKIKPKTASLKTVKSAKKAQLNVTWSKDSTVSGYEMVYATNSKFTKGKKTVTVKGAKTTSKTIKKLKSKTTYYVKVRSYKTVSGKKIYGAYSKVKKVKIK